MSDEERNIENLESEFPALSGSAFAAACRQTLDSGQSVLQSDQGVIYEVFPDGSRRPVKKIELPTSIVPGTRMKIR